MVNNDHMPAGCPQGLQPGFGRARHGRELRGPPPQMVQEAHQVGTRGTWLPAACWPGALLDITLPQDEKHAPGAEPGRRKLVVRPQQSNVDGQACRERSTQVAGWCSTLPNTGLKLRGWALWSFPQSDKLINVRMAFLRRPRGLLHNNLHSKEERFWSLECGSVQR